MSSTRSTNKNGRTRSRSGDLKETSAHSFVFDNVSHETSLGVGGTEL